jgi:wobble nucleotide-excising tRNase
VYRLRKLKELKGYRFFQDFKWNESNCKLFERNNLIYGWNGSGKTTMCDIFKELEIGQLSEAGTKLSLLFEDTIANTNTTITHNSLGTIPYAFKVFHQSYIQDTVSKVDNVKHIFAIGQGQGGRIDDLKQLKAKQKTEEALLKALKSEQSVFETALEQLKSSKASLIKNAANYTTAYNKNKFYNAYKALKSPTELDDKEYQEALTAIRAEKKDRIPLFENDFIRSTVKEYIHSILLETPVNITIKALKDDIETSNWVENGLKLHDDQNLTVCQFCGNVISFERFDALRAHFNKSYKELSDKIDAAISLLNKKGSQFDTVLSTLPDAGLFYAESREQYTELQKQAQTLCDNNKSAIEKIISILTLKKSNMISDEYVSEFKTVASVLTFDYDTFDQILSLINQHNDKTDFFAKSIETAQEKIENHMITVFTPEIIASEAAIAQKSSEVSKQNRAISELVTHISLLEQEVKNSQIPAEAMNKDIEFIMGRDELVFDNKPFGYQITRKGKIAKNLSKGEENAIALIYFFNTLIDVDVDVQNTVVVLDDPISSFDSNYYYNAISYIRDKTSRAGQVFVFTHKFSLLKDYSLMYKGETNRYMIRRVSDTPTLQDEDNLISQYHDEYAYLFKQVYQFVKEPPQHTSDYLQYPNIGRRLLEGFMTFKLPTNDALLEKVITLEDDGDTAAGRAILRLLNNHSHLRVISDGEMTDDVSNIAILPDILKNLLTFIRHHDEKHFDILAHKCDPDYSIKSDNEDLPQPVKYTIRLYDMPASAGTGNYLTDNDIPYEELEVENSECTFAVRISGNSMEPDIPDQSIVLVRQDENVPHTHVGVFFYNGESYCKKIIQATDHILLVSVNKDYKPIKIEAYNDFRTFGEVVGIINQSTN